MTGRRGPRTAPHAAGAALDLNRLTVVCPGDSAYPLTDRRQELHALLNLPHAEALRAHPGMGASWEG